VELLAHAVEFILHLDRHLDLFIRDYGTWAYALLFLIIFAETGLVVTPFLPGDSLLFAAGAIAARGSLDVGLLAVLLAVAAIVGDAVNYWIGHTLGDRLVGGGRIRLIKQEHLDRTHQFYERHGARTIILARFVPIVRTFAPFVAGFGHMTYRRFATYNIVGGITWIALFVIGGFFFGNLAVVQQHFGLVIIGIILISFVPMVLTIWQERSAARMR
jgi:membrane-associated protein